MSLSHAHSRIPTTNATSFVVLMSGQSTSAFVARILLNCLLHEDSPVANYDINPIKPATWPSVDRLIGQHVILLGTSIDAAQRASWRAAGVADIHCIDNRESSLDHYDAEECPIRIGVSLAKQVYDLFMAKELAANGSIDEYDLLGHFIDTVDRLDRWENTTFEDRCLREMMCSILPENSTDSNAYNAAQQAMIALMEHYTRTVHDPEARNDMIQPGKRLLLEKESMLFRVLQGGIFITVTDRLATQWGLPAAVWRGVRLFLVDTTGHKIDVSLAADLILNHYPSVQVFINYCHNKFFVKGSRTPSEDIKYYARSLHRDVVLTQDPAFVGRPFAATRSFKLPPVGSRGPVTSWPFHVNHEVILDHAGVPLFTLLPPELASPPLPATIVTPSQQRVAAYEAARSASRTPSPVPAPSEFPPLSRSTLYQRVRALCHTPVAYCRGDESKEVSEVAAPSPVTSVASVVPMDVTETKDDHVPVTYSDDTVSLTFRRKSVRSQRDIHTNKTVAFTYYNYDLLMIVPKNHLGHGGRLELSLLYDPVTRRIATMDCPSVSYATLGDLLRTQNVVHGRTTFSDSIIHSLNTAFQA